MRERDLRSVAVCGHELDHLRLRVTTHHDSVACSLQRAGRLAVGAPLAPLRGDLALGRLRWILAAIHEVR